MQTPRVAVIGAGVAGLTAAIDLACAGFDVRLFERGATPGGKIRSVEIHGRSMDAGPSVFTLRGLFDSLFDDAGDDFGRRVKLAPANILARHAWGAEQHLDLFANLEQSADAIGAFAGRREAEGFRRFAAQAKRIYATLDHSFMRAARPTPLDLVHRIGLGRSAELWNIQPFATLWRATARYFEDTRLRQLFGRYATYCGSSPFAAPATLMLVAHVEQAGVWYIDGGMQELADQLAALAVRKGAHLRYACEVARIQTNGTRVTAVHTSDGEQMAVDAVVCNADNNALAAGHFGTAVHRAVAPTPASARSLSAVTWNLLASTGGFELAHHSVFFSNDYRAEFDDIFRRRRLPSSPTIYVCAQDRRDASAQTEGSQERLFLLVNAPPVGDTHWFDESEIEACQTQMFQRLAHCGLTVNSRPDATLITTPSDFHRLFPATGGALYGRASHGWMASFRRAGSRSAIQGLYLAGGSSHPGPGVPMAAISGRLAAGCITSDYASIVRYHPAGMSGGTSMP
ncbi:MAG: phytoene desaturase family protein [Steroidobacteraceae bacterium]